MALMIFHCTGELPKRVFVVSCFRGYKQRFASSDGDGDDDNDDDDGEENDGNDVFHIFPNIIALQVPVFISIFTFQIAIKSTHTIIMYFHIPQTAVVSWETHDVIGNYILTSKRRKSYILITSCVSGNIASNISNDITSDFNLIHSTKPTHDAPT